MLPVSALFVLVLLSGSLVESGTSAAARVETIALPVVPDPGTCQGETRTVDELSMLFASATPVAEFVETASVTIEIGNAAEQTTVDSVTNVIYQAMACLNNSDFGRFMALLTDRAVVTNFSWVGEAVEAGDLPAELRENEPMPDELRQTLLAVGGVTWLADGRVGATMIIHDPASESPSNDAMHLIFVYVDGRWYIDDVRELN